MDNKMNKAFVLLLFFIGLYSNQANSAPVSVGPYVFDDTAFVDTVISMSGTINSNSESTSAITDLDPASYIYSSNNGYIDLSFGSTPIYNGSGNDLAFYFLGNQSTFSVSLLGNSTPAQSYTSSFLYDTSGNQYAVNVNGSYYALSAALLNLDAFGMNDTDALEGFRVNLGTNNFLSLVGGFHLEPAATVIPLPAPFLLFLSGLTALGLISRRKK